MSVEQAAGGVVFRDLDGERRVAVVHRPRYDDWSLPKGSVHDRPDKPDQRETPLRAAVREVHEETGWTAIAVRRLEPVTYDVAGGTKSVTYWTMRAVSGEFAANDETDELAWWTPQRAAAELTYPSDRAVVATAATLPEPDTTVLLVRHARAGKRSEWRGEDSVRPLDREGRRQARGLVPFARAFGVSSVFSADLVRCLQTVQPLADELGVAITEVPQLSDEFDAADPQTTLAAFGEHTVTGEVRAICSQGGAIPDLLDRLGVTSPHPSRKGSAWVLHFRDGGLVGADYYPRPAGRRRTD